MNVFKQKRKQEKNPRFNDWWIPVVVGVLLCITVAVLWWMLENRERDNLYSKVLFESEKIITSIQSDIRARIPALEHIVREWEMRGGIPEDEFINHARIYIKEFPGFQALEWVDEFFNVRWVIPLSGNEQAVGLNLAFEDERRKTLEQAKELKEPSMTPPIDLVQGGKGFLIYFPIYVNEEFDGFLLSVIKIEDWLSYILSLVESSIEQEEYRFAVYFGDSIVHKQEGMDTDAQSYLQVKRTSQIMGHPFSVEIQPTETFYKHSQSRAPEIAAIFGVLFSFLVIILIFLYQKASSLALRAQESSTALENENKERKQDQKSLKQLSTRLALATKSGGIGVWTWDLKDDVLIWDERMYEIFNLPMDVQLVHEVWRNAVHPDDISVIEKLLFDAIKGKSVYSVEYRIIINDTIIRYIKAAASVERSADQTPLRVTGVNWDITAQKEAEEKIHFMANHDALTSLPSLRLARDRISMSLSKARRTKAIIAILFIDLDGFKAVNDTYGHNAGDALLQEVGKRLLACSRESDTVARIGGDEFLMILEEIHDEEDVSRLSKKIIQTIGQPVSYANIQLQIGVCIGIALFPGDGDDDETLLKKADKAMYSIKKGEKNGYAFASKMD